MRHHRQALANSTGGGNLAQIGILMILVPLIILAALSIPMTEAFGNDTIARIGTGGITFMKSEDIRMLEEILEISLKKISVKYRFFNESGQDIHATVAFPFPPRKKTFSEEFHPSQEQFISTFAVLVDGRPVSTTANGANAVYWQQSFPAGQEVVVEHSYTPMPGDAYAAAGEGEGTGFMLQTLNRILINFFGVIPTPVTGDSVCLGRSTRQAIENRVKTHLGDGKRVLVHARDIEYILGTGRNWKGPIGKFILRIEAEPPDQFMSVCFPGEHKQVSPSVYEFVQTDFVPPDKLVVYFYSVGP